MPSAHEVIETSRATFMQVVTIFLRQKHQNFEEVHDSFDKQATDDFLSTTGAHALGSPTTFNAYFTAVWNVVGVLVAGAVITVLWKTRSQIKKWLSGEEKVTPDAADKKAKELKAQKGVTGGESAIHATEALFHAENDDDYAEVMRILEQLGDDEITKEEAAKQINKVKAKEKEGKGKDKAQEAEEGQAGPSGYGTFDTRHHKRLEERVEVLESTLKNLVFHHGKRRSPSPPSEQDSTVSPTNTEGTGATERSTTSVWDATKRWAGGEESKKAKKDAPKGNTEPAE